MGNGSIIDNMRLRKKIFLTTNAGKGVKNHNDRLFLEENLKDESKRI